MRTLAIETARRGVTVNYISPGFVDTEMMKPYGGAIEAWEVGAEVGNVKNNRPELMERMGLF